VLPAIEYPGHFLVWEITAHGTFHYGDKLLFLSNALKHYHIGLEEIADGLWSVRLSRVAGATRRAHADIRG
jgi:hypothetical protein